MFPTCDNGLVSAIFLRNLRVQKTKPVRPLRNLYDTIDQCENSDRNIEVYTQSSMFFSIIIFFFVLSSRHTALNTHCINLSSTNAIKSHWNVISSNSGLAMRRSEIFLRVHVSVSHRVIM